MQRLAWLVPVSLAGWLGLPGAACAESYGVFCTVGRISVDSRTEEQMKTQRGGCQITRLSSRVSAENYAVKNYGAVGASCSCPKEPSQSRNPSSRD